MAKASALMSMEASTRDARRLPSWTRAEREALEVKIRNVLGTWQAAHLPSGAAALFLGEGVRCETLQRAALDDQAGGWDEACWAPLGADPEAPGRNAMAWWSMGSPERSHPWDGGAARAVRELKARFFGADRRTGASTGASSLGDRVAKEAWEAWGEQMRAALNLHAPVAEAPVPLPAEVRHAWSGALVATWRWCDQVMRVVVMPGQSRLQAPTHPDMPSASHAPSAPLVPLLKAARELPVALQVELEPMDIHLGALMTLAVGDVVRTSHALEDPLLVKTLEGPGAADDGRAAFRGLLGRQGTRLAIALTALPA